MQNENEVIELRPTENGGMEIEVVTLDGNGQVIDNDDDSAVEMAMFFLTHFGLDVNTVRAPLTDSQRVLFDAKYAKQQQKDALVDAIFKEVGMTNDDQPEAVDRLTMDELNDVLAAFEGGELGETQHATIHNMLNVRDGQFDDVFGDVTFRVGLAFLSGSYIFAYYNRPETATTEAEHFVLLMRFTGDENAKRYFTFAKRTWSEVDGEPLTLAGV